MIVYGPVDGQNTEAGAMGSILRSLHRQYGNRPEVGKPFRVRGTNSVAVYFNLVKRTQANAQVAGLLIANRVSDSSVEAALVTDDAARFRKTINPMLKTLFGAWHPAAASSAPPPTQSGPAAPLHRVVTSDGSAGASLPQGWQMLPNSGGGSLFANGPNGETAVLGFALLAMNTRDPRVQQTMRFAQGAGRNTSYAQALYYPYGGDLAKSFADLLLLWRSKQHLPSGTLEITSQQRLNSPGCIYLTGNGNFPDAHGPAAFTTVFCEQPPVFGGSYLTMLNHIGVPSALAAKEQATVQAILQSFWFDQAKVNAQAATMAKPVIDAIHEIGRVSAQIAADSNAAFERRNRGLAQNQDTRDRANQDFSNYQLDLTVVQDNEQNTHSTEWNTTADALVRANPNRYEYVEKPNFWKGVDY